MNEEVTLIAGITLFILIILAFFKMNEYIAFNDNLILVFMVTVLGIGGLTALSVVNRW